MQTQATMRPALAMYTVHEAVTADLEGVFEQLAEMGYIGIEFYGEMSSFNPRTVLGALARSGLILTGWHTEWRNLQDDRFDDTVAYLHSVGCDTAVVPCLGGKWQIAHTPEDECLDVWLRHIDWLNETARRLRQNGLRMGYHNHEHEFMLHYKGQCVFELLFENLSPDVVMEFDTGNCIEGGADPVAMLKRFSARQTLLHLKPYSFQKGFDVVLGDPEDANDWKAILNVPGVTPEYLLVESECAALPEMKNARQCLRGLERFLRLK